MIRVCMEVHEGAAPRKVEVQAGSISRAVSITKGRYPDSDVRAVVFGPDGLLAGGYHARGGIRGTEVPMENEINEHREVYSGDHLDRRLSPECGGHVR